MITMTRLLNLTTIFLLSVLFLSCKNDEGEDWTDDTVTGPDLMAYGLTNNNELVSFNARMPNSTQSRETISGIASGERLLSIDFRPATGELYALSNASKLYVINAEKASARMVGEAAFTPAIEGTIASIDFNPTVDRIRLVTNTGQNLRLHPETGAVVATDGRINGAGSPSISGVAYTNSKAGASSTVLYDIDGVTGKLYKQDPPNDGGLVEVGSLGFMFSGSGAFDISPDNGAALLAATSGNESMLYMVDINDGKTGRIGALATAIIDMAIPTYPVAYAVDASNTLHIVNPATAEIVTKPITGLQDGERIHGIDFRPLNGQLYAIGSSSRLYVINLSSGAASAVGSMPFSPMLEGDNFGFDFNPTVDRIRLVSSSGQNLRLHPVTGEVVAVDGTLNPGSPEASAAAYTDNFAGTTTTTLYIADHNTNMLYTQIPPNDGTLVAVGALGVDIDGANGMDIGSASNHAYLVATSGGATKLYQVNLTSGAATAVADLPQAVTGFAIGTGF